MRVPAVLAALAAALLLQALPTTAGAAHPAANPRWQQIGTREPPASNPASSQLRAAAAAALGVSVAAGRQHGVAGVGPWGEWIPKNATQAVSCGLAGISPYFTIHLAGVNLSAHPDACGRCVSVRCTDAARCGDTSASVTAAVVDVCGAGPAPACGPGDVLLNSFSFRQLAARPALAANAFPAEWRFVPCRPWGDVYQPTPGGAAGLGAASQRAAATEPGSSASPAPAGEPEAEPDSQAAPPAAAPVAKKSLQAPAPAPAPELPPEVEGTAATAAAPSPEQLEIAVGAGRSVTPGEPAWAAPGNVGYAAGSRPRPVVNSTAGFQPASGQAGAAAQPEVLAFAAPPAPLAEGGQAGEEAAAGPAPAQEPTSEAPPATPPAPEGGPRLPADPEEASPPRQGAEGQPGQARASAPAAEAGAKAPAAAERRHQGRGRTAAVKLSRHASGGASACGRCVRVACPGGGGACPAGGVLAIVLDDCGHCGREELLLSREAFRELGGNNGSSGSGSVTAAWAFADCGESLAREVYMRVLPGGNDFYRALTWSNARQPVAAASINGQPLRRDGTRWVWQAGGGKLDLARPLAVRLTSSTGQTVEGRVASLTSQPLVGAQFSAAAGG